MAVDFAIADKVRQLRHEGLRPSERLTRLITQTGEAAVAPLLALARETDLLYQDAPECYAPIHALRLLGEFKSAEIIVPLLNTLPIDLTYQERGDPAEIWSTEVPQIIARIGPAASQTLWAFADDETRNMGARSVALETLAFVTAVAPETSEEIVTGLRERLDRTEDKDLRSHLVATLAELGVKELYGNVMSLYRNGQLNQQIIPAAVARQLLLAEGERRLKCANHPLWERYDQHGPQPPSPNRQ